MDAQECSPFRQTTDLLGVTGRGQGQGLGPVCAGLEPVAAAPGQVGLHGAVLPGRGSVSPDASVLSPLRYTCPEYRGPPGSPGSTGASTAGLPRLHHRRLVSISGAPTAAHCFGHLLSLPLSPCFHLGRVHSRTTASARPPGIYIYIYIYIYIHTYIYIYIYIYIYMYIGRAGPPRSRSAAPSPRPSRPCRRPRT